MKVIADCIPCYLRQVLNTVRTAGYPEDRATEVIINAMKVIPGLGSEATPAENSTIVLLEAYKTMGIQDPYREAKRESNKLALGLLKEVAAIAENSADHLLAALKISVAGNIIDMGIMPDFDINMTLKEITGKEFDRSDYSEFRIDLKRAHKVMIIGDNSGEIVFDRILADELKVYNPGIELTYAVKGSPILNDATMEDARETGMDKAARVITNGSGYLGTILERCSADFLRELDDADLVIAKGQANYESLERSTAAGLKTYFLLRVKCPSVASNAGVNFGDILFIKNRM